MERDKSHTSIDVKTPLPRLPPPTSSRTTAARTQALTALQKEAVAIEKEAVEVRLRLSSVYTQLNALSHISLLPPELLSRIFRILRDDWKFLVIFKLLGWVAVTHVCRQWRQVALEDASLWTKIGSPGFYFNHNWFLEMLNRSKRVNIDITMPFEPSPETLLTLSHHFSRIRTLTLHNFGETFYNLRRHTFLRSEAPALEEFVMTPMDPTLVKSYCVSPSDRPPPGYKLFSGQVPKLRKMRLNCFPIPWKYLPKCALTHLQVSGGSGLAYCTSSEGLDPLINVLTDTAPTLEMLSLDGCLPPLRSQSIQPRIIELPRLSQLYLKGSSSGAVDLLLSLKMPPLAQLGLHLVAERGEEAASWPIIVPFAISYLDNPKLPAFHTLCLEFGPEIGLTSTTVCASRTADIFDEPRSVHEVDLLLKFENESFLTNGSCEIIQSVRGTELDGAPLLGSRSLLHESSSRLGRPLSVMCGGYYPENQRIGDDVSLAGYDAPYACSPRGCYQQRSLSSGRDAATE
ncbi:hypothetical protein BC834DRAFT_237118 [Gloeopeniophorella convolvens]|nr:hypothetical protein BC834DRAFT_237118 [Gloeopeniophorella convolvens]